MPGGRATASTESTARILASYCTRLRYQDLPPDVVDVLKRLVLDALGCALAGSSLGVGCRELLNVLAKSGGPAEASVLGCGQRLPMLAAATVNGAYAHALNYDAATSNPGIIRDPGLGFLPAPLLSIAEAKGSVSGPSYLAALAAAVEVAARLGASVTISQPERFAMDGQVLSTFGIAAGAGRLLALNAAQMQSALGLALMQTCGTLQLLFDGDPPAKAIYAGFPSHGGTLAALLSQQGLGAHMDVFGGKGGLFAVYYRGQYDPAILTEGLGTEYHLRRVAFKPWPSSGKCSPFIQAALELSPPVHAISHVHIEAGPDDRGWLEPAEVRKRPPNPAAAANSIYYAVAHALLSGGVSLHDLTPQGLGGAQVDSLTDRMSHTIREDLSGAIVKIDLTSGEQLAKQVDPPLPPMSWTQLVRKFHECAGYSALALKHSAIDEAIATIQHLDEAPDVGVLGQLLGGSGL